MKLKISYYSLKLLKDNTIYILVFISTIVLSVFIFYSFYQKKINNNSRIQQAQTELAGFKNRKDALDASITSNYAEVKDFNIILNKLIPSAEDYFSVIYALEKISQDTGFVISNYSIDLSQSKNERMTLAVKGNGDINAFLKFLDNYNFSSGRLITMNDFDFNHKGIQYQLSLNFYNKPVLKEAGTLALLNKKDLQFMRDLKNKVSFILTTSSSSAPEVPQNTDLTYPTTEDIF